MERDYGEDVVLGQNYVNYDGCDYNEDMVLALTSGDDVGGDDGNLSRGSRKGGYGNQGRSIKPK